MLIAVYLIILVAAFFFLIVRPQRRQQMIRRQIIAAVEVGDEIITNGGVYGTVVALDGETLDLRIAPDVVIKVARGAVADRLTTPDDPDGEGDGEGDGNELDEGEDEGPDHP